MRMKQPVRRIREELYRDLDYDAIWRLLNALEEQGLAENTVVIHTSDHGESLGEHGLWCKMNFYEQAARVPLQISWPGVLPGGRRVPGAVSLVDLTTTIVDLGKVPDDDRALWAMDGDSLLPLIQGDGAAWKDEAFVEHLAHGTDRARAMIRQGSWKLSYSHGDPPDLELYNLDTDPGEFTNLAGNPAHQQVQDRLLSRIMELWGDPDRLTHRIVASQEARLLIRQVAGDESPF